MTGTSDLVSLAGRIPAPVARSALVWMIRTRGEFAQYAEFARLAERFPPAAYTYQGGKPNALWRPGDRPCEKCGAQPGSPCIKLRDPGRGRLLGRGYHPGRGVPA